MSRLRNWAVPAFVVVAMGCNGEPPAGLDGVSQIVYLQRSGSETGNVFDYAPGGAASDQADLYLLSPPTATGTRTNLTRLPAGSDINAFDLSFDATEIVFSARLKAGESFHLFRIHLDGSNPCEPGSRGYCQITDGPYDEVYPIYLPGDRIFYVTNQDVEAVGKQFRDEYERATTSQVATIARAGGDPQLGARNVSHRVSPTLLSDGRVLFTQWDHLGGTNEGNLMILSQDLTGNREGFGKEGKGLTNAYLRAREVAPGQLVTIGSSRDRTFQAGKLLLVSLGTKVGNAVDLTTLSEANSSAEDLTPDVPGGREPSYAGVGRYYDATPIGNIADKRFLVSWADGPVQTEILGMASQMPSFGIYLYDARAHTRFPIVVNRGAWAVSPRPVQKRAEPPVLASSNMAMGTQSTLVSAINVYNSSLFQIAPGSVKKVRIMEGFSGEEGGMGDFGLTEFDGHALLGEIDPNADGSFKALVPPNVPVHIQLVDEFGMAVQATNGSLASEPIWIQGRAGEARVCGGCHEDRTKTPQLQPGSSALQAAGAAALDLPRAQRMSTMYAPGKVMGVPWDKALQPLFDAHCTDCHDGTMNGANKSYTVMDITDKLTFKWTFDLTGKPIGATVGGAMYGYSASHLSLLGPSMMFREKQVMFVGGVMPDIFIEPGSARHSKLFNLLNPPRRHPTVDPAVRAYPTPIHPSEITKSINGHQGTDGKYKLSPDEYYLLVLMADMGGQFYSRENIPGGK